MNLTTIYQLTLLIAGFVLYIIRIEKCLTSLKKDICYIKKHCPHCKTNPDSENGDSRPDAETT